MGNECMVKLSSIWYLVVVFIEPGSGCLLGRTAFEFEVRLRWAIWFCKVRPWVMNEEMGVRGWVRLGLG